MPVDENAPQRPVSPYGISKMVTEHYLRFYQSEHGLDYTALRYGNVYGPRQDPNGEAGVIAIFVAKFLAGEGVRIDWDGEQTRDYVYVGDVVRANVAALTRGSGEIYVIGTGVKTSVNHDLRRPWSKRPASRRRSPARRAAPATPAISSSTRPKPRASWAGLPRSTCAPGLDATAAYFRERTHRAGVGLRMPTGLRNDDVQQLVRHEDALADGLARGVRLHAALGHGQRDRPRPRRCPAPPARGRAPCRSLGRRA